MTRAALAFAVCLAACASAERGVAVSGVFVVPGAGLAPGAVYATIGNARDVGDTLVAVEMADGSPVMLHSSAMQSVQRIFVPPHGEIRLKPGGVHGMAAHVTGARGDSTRVTFFFSGAGQITARATVIDYAQVDSAVGRGGSAP